MKYPIDLKFHKAVKMLIKNPKDALIPGRGTLGNLISSWNNVVWSANDEFLMSCIRNSYMYKDRPIVECGSGLTTIVIGIIAQQTGNTLWTVENSEYWGNRVIQILSFYKINSVRVLITALKDYGSYCWYNVCPDALPERIGLVICDGPPGETKGGRSGLIHELKSKFDDKTKILLDDASRQSEQMLAKYCENKYGADVFISGIRKPFFQIIF